MAKEFKNYFKTLFNNKIHRSADKIHITYSTAESFINNPTGTEINNVTNKLKNNKSQNKEQ